MNDSIVAWDVGFTHHLTISQIKGKTEFIDYFWFKGPEQDEVQIVSQALVSHHATCFLSVPMVCFWADLKSWSSSIMGLNNEQSSASYSGS